MKFTKLLAAAAVAAVAMGSQSAMAADATASASATVVAPIAINKTADLNFGTLVAPAAASVVTVIVSEVDGARSGTATLGSGTGTAASFTVSGEGASTYSFVIDDTALSPPVGMSVELDTSLAIAGVLTTTGTLVAGEQVVTVGGTLTVDGDDYVAGVGLKNLGSFTATVAYN